MDQHEPDRTPDHTHLRRALRATTLLAALGVSAACATASPLPGQEVVPEISRELAVVERHMATPGLRAALEFVETQQADPADVIQDFLGLCNTYGPSGDEINRSRHIYKMFRIYGLESVYIDGDNNVIAVRRGTGDGPAVVLNAHHDNVRSWPADQQINAFVRDDRIYCPAAGDDLPGVVGLFTILRAMDAADIRTRGDVWFVSFAGEETGSRPAANFARAHYPHNLDWRNGDALVQLHGAAGVGATTGGGPIINLTTLHIFTPFERSVVGEPGSDRRWRPHANDVLARALVRIRSELTDPRSDCLRCPGREGGERAQWYINPAMIQSSPAVNRPVSEASVKLDIRAPDLPTMRRIHGQIKAIAEETCAELRSTGFPPHHYTDRCDYMLNVDEVYGRDPADPIPGWDPVDNPQARMVAASANALYGFEPTIDPSRGCGDCRNLYKMGLPGMSFRGNVIDYGGGRVERSYPEPTRLGGHDVTESAAIAIIWSAIKHALVFAASYAGMEGVQGLDQRN